MGKPQILEHKAAAGFVENRPVWANAEDLQDIQEELASMEKVRLRTNLRATKVSRFMKDNYFRTDKTFVYLYWQKMKRQLFDEFFPEKNLLLTSSSIGIRISWPRLSLRRRYLRRMASNTSRCFLSTNYLI